MTRAQVARRIGRSIATVRRMEGKELHPEVDWNGVHRFDADEVAAVAEELRENGRRRSEYTDDLPDFLAASRLGAVERERDELRRTVGELQNLDAVAAALLRISSDAMELLERSRCRGTALLRAEFEQVLRSLRD